jgi:hypothetical protein
MCGTAACDGTANTIARAGNQEYPVAQKIGGRVVITHRFILLAGYSRWSNFLGTL